jgi:hypothetical protein
MKNFIQYIQEEQEYQNGGLSIFDIDDTLFHTTAKIAVIKNGKKIKELTNQEFNTYKLGAGESFDFGEFRDAAKFNKESKPIGRMLDKAKAILKNSENNPLSRVIIVTARNDFDNKEVFLNTFRKHGFNIDKVRVERAGKITDVHDVAFKKVIIIKNYLNTKRFKRVRLFDDSMANLRAFLKLRTEFPMVKFEAFFAKPDGRVTNVKL